MSSSTSVDIDRRAEFVERTCPRLSPAHAKAIAQFSIPDIHANIEEAIESAPETPRTPSPRRRVPNAQTAEGDTASPEKETPPPAIAPGSRPHSEPVKRPHPMDAAIPKVKRTRKHTLTEEVSDRIEKNYAVWLQEEPSVKGKDRNEDTVKTYCRAITNKVAFSVPLNESVEEATRKQGEKNTDVLRSFKFFSRFLEENGLDTAVSEEQIEETLRNLEEVAEKPRCLSEGLFERVLEEFEKSLDWKKEPESEDTNKKKVRAIKMKVDPKLTLKRSAQKALEAQGGKNRDYILWLNNFLEFLEETGLGSPSTKVDLRKALNTISSASSASSSASSWE